MFDETVAKVYAGYQRRLVQAGAIDFDDLLYNAVTLLEDVPDVRSRWQRRFQHVMVDEYQDTNHAQYRIVRALAAEQQNSTSSAIRISPSTPGAAPTSATSSTSAATSRAAR